MTNSLKMLIILSTSLIKRKNDDVLKMVTDDICKLEGCPDWGNQGENIMSGCGKCPYCIAQQND